jgi:hypothetical protein
MTIADAIRSSIDHQRDKLVGAFDGYLKWRQEIRIARDRR